LIYEAALDPSQWPRFLETLGETIHGHNLLLSSVSTQPELGIEATGRPDPEYLSRYARDYHDKDPWLIAGAASGHLRPGVVALGEEILSRDAFRKSVFFADLGHRYKVYGGVAAVVAGPDSLGALSSHQFAFGQFDDAERTLFSVLAPHVERALLLHARMTNLEVRQRAAADVIDRIPAAVILVDRDGRPVLVNRAAREILQEGDGLRSDREGLTTRRPSETQSLRALVAACLRTSAGLGLSAGGTLKVLRPDPKPALQLLVSPLRSGDSLRESASTPGAVIFIHDPARTAGPSPDVLMHLYGFTLPLGTHALRLTVVDDQGNYHSDDLSVRVVDTTPPAIVSATPSVNVLWPVNHRMVPVTVAVTAQDLVDPAPVCKVMWITSNEAAGAPGSGPAGTDVELAGPLSMTLRASRSGRGAGRVYTAGVECSDFSGNPATTTVTVSVPHDQGRR
jgi:PAS domain-containing protein